MKSLALFTAALLTAVPLVQAADPVPTTSPTGRAEVVYVDPENFTDARDSYTGSDAGRENILESIREYVAERANHFIPEGHKLFVSVSELDLAGDFEPWRGPTWDDVRIVKDIYPPRINLSFRLTNPAGQVIKEGKRELRDIAFLMKITTGFRDDPLRHEKTLLDDWFRAEFRDLAKR